MGCFYISSLGEKNVQNTAEKIYEMLKPFLQSLLDNKVKLVAIVTDNEATMGSLKAKVVADYPFIVPVPCAAHIIQVI